MNLPIRVQDFQQYFIKFESEHRDLLNHDVRLVLSLKEEKNEFIFDYLRRSSEAQIVDNLKTIMWVTLNNCPTYECKVLNLKHHWMIYFDEDFLFLSPDDNYPALSLKKKLSFLILTYKNLLNLSLYFNNAGILPILFRYPFKITVVTILAALLGSGYKYFDYLLSRVENLELSERSFYFLNKIDEFEKNNQITMPVTPEFFILHQHNSAEFNNGQELLWLLSTRCKLDLTYLIDSCADYGYFFDYSPFFDFLWNRELLQKKLQ